MELQAVLNTFAKEIFRKQADFDYITARMNYKMQFRQQFLWSAQQAIEKYFKAILLFNGESTINYGHDLVTLYTEVKKIDYLEIKLPKFTSDFLNHLTKYGGNNRYMTNFSYNESNSLRKLDELAWNIRRYCQFIPDQCLGSDSRIDGLKEAVINRINHPTFLKSPNIFTISGGELEKILDKPADEPARIALVWSNLYFGKKKRFKVKHKAFASSETPPQFRDWFIKDVEFNEISKFIKFDKNTIEIIQKMKNTKRE